MTGFRGSRWPSILDMTFAVIRGGSRRPRSCPCITAKVIPTPNANSTPESGHLGPREAGGLLPGYPSTKLSRTILVALSAFGSRRAIDCHVPRASRPATTGIVTDGETSSGTT